MSVMPMHSRSTARCHVSTSPVSSAKASLICTCCGPNGPLDVPAGRRSALDHALAIGRELHAADAGRQPRQADHVAGRQLLEQHLAGAHDRLRPADANVPSSTTKSSRRPVVGASFDVGSPAAGGAVGVGRRAWR